MRLIFLYLFNMIIMSRCSAFLRARSLFHHQTLPSRFITDNHDDSASIIKGESRKGLRMQYDQKKSRRSGIGANDKPTMHKRWSSSRRRDTSMLAHKSHPQRISAIHATSAPSSIQSAASIIIAPPLKVMIFIDGTWLYYTLIEGRENCPIRKKFGSNWIKSHRIDYNKLSQLIASNIKQQLVTKGAEDRVVEVVRTSVATSVRKDTEADSSRIGMVSDFYLSNFHVMLFRTDGPTEKCVDIALAVEMLYMATVQGAYDIAVILTGDKDFMPAMEKTRLMAKRVALVSMRNSCNRDLAMPEHNLRDFNVIWLDDMISDMIIERPSIQYTDETLVRLVSEVLQGAGGSLPSREIGRHLQSVLLDDRDNALLLMKQLHVSLSFFLAKHADIFEREYVDDSTEYLVHLKKSPEDGLIDRGFVLTSSDRLVMSIAGQDIDDALESSGQGDVANMNTEMYQRALEEADSEDDVTHYRRYGMRDGEPLVVMSASASSSDVGDSEQQAADRSDEEVANSALNFVRFMIEMSEEGEMSSRDIGRSLQAKEISMLGAHGGSETTDLLSYIKSKHGSLNTFISKYQSLFAVRFLSKSEYCVSLVPETAEEEVDVTEVNDKDRVISLADELIDEDVKREEVDSSPVISTERPVVKKRSVKRKAKVVVDTQEDGGTDDGLLVPEEKKKKPRSRKTTK